MKEKIYTIPVNEAFDTDCECPLCVLSSRLEAEAVEYALGAAMMEPDYRIISNEKGYCNNHYKMLLEKPNKLSLTLTMDTHYDELLKKIISLKESATEMKDEKKGLFSKGKSEGFDKCLNLLKNSVCSCVICEKVETTMKRYVSVFFHMWEKDENFRKKAENSKGFCLPHFLLLIEGAKEYLGKKKYEEFYSFICRKEEEEIKRVHTDVHKFTLKFDYRNHGSAWGTEIDAPVRGVEKLSGYTENPNKQK